MKNRDKTGWSMDKKIIFTAAAVGAAIGISSVVVALAHSLDTCNEDNCVTNPYTHEVYNLNLLEGCLKFVASIDVSGSLKMSYPYMCNVYQDIDCCEFAEQISLMGQDTY